jgi:hypothetical protein
MFKAIALIIILSNGTVVGPLESKPSFDTKAACDAWVVESDSKNKIIAGAADQGWGEVSVEIECLDQAAK